MERNREARAREPEQATLFMRARATPDGVAKEPTERALLLELAKDSFRQQIARGSAPSCGFAIHQAILSQSPPWTSRGIVARMVAVPSKPAREGGHLSLISHVRS